jgi:hypothetical protein
MDRAPFNRVSFKRSSFQRFDEGADDQSSMDTDEGEQIDQAIVKLSRMGLDRSAMTGVPLIALNEILRFVSGLSEPTSKKMDDIEASDYREIKRHYEAFKEFYPAAASAAALIRGYRCAKRHDRSLSVQKFLGFEQPADTGRVERFAEAFVQAGGDDVKTIRAWFNQFREHQPAGATAERLVAGYRAAKKHQPGLTVEKFLTQ